MIKSRGQKMCVVLGVFSLSLWAAGCGRNASDLQQKKSESNASSQQTSQTLRTAEKEGAIETVDGVVVVHFVVGDEIKFSFDGFTVPAGVQVRIELRHTGKMPAAAMGHNVVILREGEDAIAFGEQSLSQGGNLENQYVPDAMREKTLVFTDLIGGGESTSTTFTAPAKPGKYAFLCVFPGHVLMMNGVMTVE